MTSTTRMWGIDVSTPVTADQWNYMIVNRNCQFAVVRAYRNAQGGITDESCPATVAAAWEANMEFVDVYHFPVITTKTATVQANELLAFLDRNGVVCGRVWLDVEASASWHADVANNVAFIHEYVTAIEQNTRKVGIYCGTTGWKKITGDSHEFSDLPLWWSSHGYQKQFVEFGGWPAPLLVQYAYNQSRYGMSYDSNYTDSMPATPTGPSAPSGPLPAGRTMRIQISGVLDLTID